MKKDQKQSCFECAGTRIGDTWATEFDKLSEYDEPHWGGLTQCGDMHTFRKFRVIREEFAPETPYSVAIDIRQVIWEGDDMANYKEGLGCFDESPSTVNRWMEVAIEGIFYPCNKQGRPSYGCPECGRPKVTSSDFCCYKDEDKSYYD